MLPQLPVIDPKVNGARSGGLLNRLVDRIKLQRLLSSETVIITETKDGQIIDRLGSGGVAAPFALGFAVSLDGTNVVVAPGRLLYPLWGAILGDNPTPGDWQKEVNYIGGTLTGTVTQVWLSVLWSESDTTTTGPWRWWWWRGCGPATRYPWDGGRCRRQWRRDRPRRQRRYRA